MFNHMPRNYLRTIEKMVNSNRGSESTDDSSDRRGTERKKERPFRFGESKAFKMEAK